MTFRLAALLVLCGLVGSVRAACAAEEPLNFGRDIRPILSENCFHCHGADEAKRQAELRLDERDVAVELGAIVPGKPEESPLVERINSNDPDVKMPPAESKRQLTPEQIELLTRWVREGAAYSPHWAFQAPRKPEVPQLPDDAWSRNAIDRFVLAKLETDGLKPSARAPMPVLLRRISFDVTGLPPTREQLAAWQGSSDPVAAALDQLLASPRFGERMAVDWMDVARYADTHGFNNDTLRTMWRWRDWVIDAFNANMPYSQFIIEQLAGDQLPRATLEQRVATGFNRNHVINSEGGIIDEEYRVEYVADRVRTTSLAWLGLTLECARCHDHKYDPLSQQDYYRMFAFFNSVDETGEDGRVGNASPLMRAPTKEQVAQYAEMQKHEGEMKAALEQAIAEPAKAAANASAAGAAAEASPWDELGKQAALSVAFEPTQFPQRQPMGADLAKVELGKGWRFAAWVKRESDVAAALVSTMDFSAPASSQGYGAGMQVGLTAAGAVDVRLAHRWPAYSLEVISIETLPVGEWRHVAVAGSGKSAGEIRIFIDGVEAETDVRHDDLTSEVTVEGKARIGYSGEPGVEPFHGTMHRVRILPGAVDEQFEKMLAREALSLALLAGGEADESSWGQGLARITGERTGEGDAFSKAFADWRIARQERLAFLRSFPTLMVVEDLREPRPTFVLERGQYDKPGDPVEPGVPEALGLALPGGRRDRVALARWFTDSRHPLTARVVVNRFWQSMFGVGLVKTVEDFGTRSEWPSHPELIDWLAIDFIESGWDVKRFVRQIVESATYQQDSSAPATAWAADPENRLLARGPRQRLTAEMMRDQALAVSSLLAERIGGPPVFPAQPADLYKGIVVEAGYPGATYGTSEGDDLHRRSMYTFWKRTVPHSTLSTFDAPDREFCTARRSVTNTPLQALVLMNDPIFLEAARGLGQRMFESGGESAESRLAWGFEAVTARTPSAEEVARLVAVLEDQRSEFASGNSKVNGLLASDPKPEELTQAAERAAYVSVASLLLNLDEAITRN